MSKLFSAFSLRGLEFRNRVFVSPMCQYSSRDGLANDWHMVHLGSRAVGGAALVVAEATGVSPEARISPGDTGLWSEEHAQAFAPVAAFIKSQGARAGIQLAHAGRKASTHVAWKGGKPLSEDEGPWRTLAPSAVPFGDWPAPKEMTREDIETVIRQFEDSTRLALSAGFEVVELHMAHGYLMHEFLSPLSNKREDEYGGPLENRARFPLRVAEAVRAVLPQELPLFARISATDWVEGGWDLQQSVQFSRWMKERGVDLVDCSSGGLVPGARIPVEPNYQVPFAEAIRKEAGVATGAVGLITEPEQAEEIVASGKADAVFLARAMLRDPYWTLHAAKRLGVDVPWPVQYGRAKD
ncbi:MAG TPA: NADH:flavin oxidoreductase/NADH oxidase [Pyrinomonadaceae bacterium]|nr:NADH:flavin oxidoreductase/NADH oxidase [Pyrinomonadaceae bacterium]